MEKIKYVYNVTLRESSSNNQLEADSLRYFLVSMNYKSYGVVDGNHVNIADEIARSALARGIKSPGEILLTSILTTDIISREKERLEEGIRDGEYMLDTIVRSLNVDELRAIRRRISEFEFK